MKKFAFAICFVLSISMLAQQLYFPPKIGNQWDTISPSSLNFCQERVDSLYSFLNMEQSKSFMLLKDGKIVLEKYFGNYTEDSLWVWFSAGKSLRSLLVGIAQEEGHLSIHDKTSKYLGNGWSSLTQAQEDSITIRHQLTMTSGLNELDFDCITPNCLTYVADAGARWAYHNGPYNLLKDVLDSATGIGINFYTQTRIKSKIGMKSGLWLQLGNNTFFFSKARDMARFGLLVQAKGNWGGTAVITDTNYITAMTSTSQALNKGYGYLWWVNGSSDHMVPIDRTVYSGSIAPNAPADAFSALGAEGQIISISPSMGYVLIRQGRAVAGLAAEDFHDDLWEYVMKLNCSISIDENIPNHEINIYPNPSEIALNLIFNLKEPSAFEVSIFSLHGRKVLELKNQKTIDISSLPAGNYLIQVQSGANVYTEKFVKK